MFIVYNLILTLLSPIWVPWMIWRTKKRKESPNWAERQGSYEKSLPAKGKNEKRIWVHAVSVGEVVAATPFLKELRAQNPKAKIVLSVTTSSGHQTAREKLNGLYDWLVYFPIDVPRFQLRAMQCVRPDVVAVMETELWFNFLWAADTFSVPVILVNGRSSDRAFSRSMKFRWFFRAMLKMVSRVLVQTEGDKSRFEQLGATTVEVFGNTKFDEAAGIVGADPAHWRQELKIPEGRKVVVIGSTRSEKEEELVANAFTGDGNHEYVFVHAPRHLETADRLVETFQKVQRDTLSGLALADQGNIASKTIAKRTEGKFADYIVLDTYGELGSVYSIADVVVIGGGFDKLGGQNLIQPLALGKPVLHGPHMFNFRDVASASVEAGASIICKDGGDLFNHFDRLIKSPAEAEKMSLAAKELVHKNLGASKRYAEAVLSVIK